MALFFKKSYSIKKFCRFIDYSINISTIKTIAPAKQSALNIDIITSLACGFNLDAFFAFAFSLNCSLTSCVVLNSFSGLFIFGRVNGGRGGTCLF